MNHVVSIAEQLQSRLRAGVLTEEFAPGERLKEEQLAAKYHVGRAMVREALRQLVQEGLLVAKVNCGVRVAPAPNGVVKAALTPVRQTLECCALRQWFERRQPPDFNAWEKGLAKMYAACVAGDHAGVIDADIAFHELLFHHAGLDELLPVWRPVMLPLRAYHHRRNQRLAADEMLVIHAIHRALLETFRGGSLSAAEKALASHVTDGAFNLRVKKRFYAAKQRAGGKAKRAGKREARK